MFGYGLEVSSTYTYNTFHNSNNTENHLNAHCVIHAKIRAAHNTSH